MNMKIKIDLNVLAIVIMAIVVVVITMSIIMAHTAFVNAHKDRIEDPALQKTNGNAKHTVEIITPVTDKNNKIVDAHKFLLLINVTQRMLENTIKSNNEIAFMAVYLEDGTIIAHIKPERIGKNMSDVDVEFSDYTQDIFEAMKNRSVYKGFKYDPLLNDNIRFMVKPLQVGNFEQNLSLLIGVHETSHESI